MQLDIYMKLDIHSCEETLHGISHGSSLWRVLHACLHDMI